MSRTPKVVQPGEPGFEAYILGSLNAAKTKPASTSPDIPPLSTFLSDDEDDPSSAKPSTSRDSKGTEEQTRPKEVNPADQRPDEQLVSSLLSSSSASFLFATIKSLPRYIFYLIGLNLLLLALSYPIPYLFKALHWGLRGVEWIVMFLLRATRWLSKWGSLAIVIAGFVMAIAGLWFRYGEPWWSGTRQASKSKLKEGRDGKVRDGEKKPLKKE